MNAALDSRPLQLSPTVSLFHLVRSERMEGFHVPDSTVLARRCPPPRTCDSKKHLSNAHWMLIMLDHRTMVGTRPSTARYKSVIAPTRRYAGTFAFTPLTSMSSHMCVRTVFDAVVDGMIVPGRHNGHL